MKQKHFIIVIFLLSTILSYSKTKGKEITRIAEASGISYCADSNTFMVVNDEGIVYEITSKGKVIEKIKLGNYDFEGVVCKKKSLFIAREDKAILKVDRETKKVKKIPLDTIYEGKKVKLFDKEEGVEGMSKVKNTLYLAKQSKKKKTSYIVVFRLKPYPSRIIDIIRPGFVDISGLTYHENALYILSDKEDLLLKYDLDKKKILQKVKLEKGAWEGIAFDDKEHVYLADDDGRVVKYKKKHLGL